MYIPGKQNREQEVHLNIVPIIDCFTVLITFLIISSAYLSVGILDAGISASGEPEEASDPPEIQLTVKLQENHGFHVQIRGKRSSAWEIGAQDSEWDHEALNARLSQIKEEFPSTKGMTLEADNSVEYQELIYTMNQVEEVIPQVILGGF